MGTEADGAVLRGGWKGEIRCFGRRKRRSQKIRNLSQQINEVKAVTQIKTTFAEWTAGWFDVYNVGQYQADRFVVAGVDMSKEPLDVWIFPAGTFIEYSNKATMRDGSILYRLGLESRNRKHSNQTQRDLLRDHHLNVWGILT